MYKLFEDVFKDNCKIISYYSLNVIGFFYGSLNAF